MSAVPARRETTPGGDTPEGITDVAQCQASLRSILPIDSGNSPCYDRSMKGFTQWESH